MLRSSDGIILSDTVFYLPNFIIILYILMYILIKNIMETNFMKIWSDNITYLIKFIKRKQKI